MNRLRLRTFRFCVRAGLVLGLLFLLGGCGSTPVAEDLSQNQANEIVSLLSSHGLASFSKKDSGGRGRYSVQVKRGSYTEAIQLMTQKGLPSEPRPTFEEFVAAKGILPNSREFEALRLDHALAMEIEELISQHPSVQSVRAVVRQHSVRGQAPGGISLVIQERRNLLLPREEILALVSKVMPGVKPEHILISTQPAPSTGGDLGSEGIINNDGTLTKVPLVPFVFNWRVPEDNYTAMVVVMLFCGLIIAVIGGLVGYWFGVITTSRGQSDAGLPDLGSKILKLDRGGRDQPEV